MWVGWRVRELLGRRSSWVLKNEIQRVKTELSGSPDLACLVTPPPDTSWIEHLP